MGEQVAAGYKNKIRNPQRERVFPAVRRQKRHARKEFCLVTAGGKPAKIVP